MSRSLRIQYKGAWYHVMNRGGARLKGSSLDLFSFGPWINGG